MAAATSTDLQILNKPFLPSKLGRRRTPCFFFCYSPVAKFSGRISVSSSSVGDGRSRSCPVRCLRATNSRSEDVALPDETERPPFDINLAVILAGFAFEAYYTPPENIGRHEIDAAGCKTVYLSGSFLREIYDGQLFIKLKKGSSFPAMDPWGTSDPYVVMQWGGQVVKSKVKWGQKNPTWNEEFTLNIKLPPSETLQVAAWDANLVTPHKRMGYTGINVEGLCDGSSHELLVELEGIGGGGQILMEIKYKSFGEIDDEKVWWRIPFFSDFLRKNGLESAFKVLDGSETVRARQFVQYAFGQLKSFNDAYLQKRWLSESKQETDRYEQFDDPSDEADTPLASDNGTEVSSVVGSDWKKNLTESKCDNDGMDSESVSMVRHAGDAAESSSSFWKNFADVITQNVVQKLGISTPDQLKWDVFDLLNRSGLQSTRVAEAQYIESGLATPRSQEVDVDSRESSLLNISKIQSSLPDVKKATEDLMRQTDSIFGALVILAASVSQLKKKSHNVQTSKTEEGGSSLVDDESADDIMSSKYTGLDERRAEDMKALFSTAESAMEAWAMLATSLGQPSFIKSEFEKLCFLDNSSTDTQVALWRDCMQKRLVVSFRGTEQTRWKDLRTDLMLAPAGLNPERIGGDFKQEVQVHSGFLAAYDSVRTRIISLIQLAIGYRVDDAEFQTKWHVYVTGHSLGGALATLLALELSSGQMAKTGAISITMYNFGSPRVGNRRFAEFYNEKVMDSWRVVNHRDIIPTVPRLMGYCHVAQPIYLATGDLTNTLENMELLDDGYQSDVIGESTPDVLVSEFMKGEKELVEKLLQTEINIFRSIRDGSALMQHMEDFYYITLLENVRSKYQTSSVEQSIDNGLSSS